MLSKYFILVLALIAFGPNQTAVCADEVSAVDESSTSGPTITLLPLANLTDSPEAVLLVTSLLQRDLRGMPLELIDNAELRPILRRHRIRSVGAIDRAGAASLVRELGIDYLVVGSVDAYRADSLPELAFSIRLLDAKSMTVKWATSVGATGAEFGTVLGIGRITDIDLLGDRLVSRALDGFLSAMNSNHSAPPGVRNIALVPFESLESSVKAGAIVTSQILTQLAERGFAVTEPGEVVRVCRTMGQFPRGEIGHDLLAILADSLSIDLVITGTVDYLHRGTPGVQGQSGKIGFGARVIEAPSGRILTARDIEYVSGASLFNGSVHSAIDDLVRPAVSKLLHQLEIEKKAQIVIP